MVFLADFKKEFYDVIQGERVLVLVSMEVDSLCAWKVLQYLFRSDHILYTIIPINCKKDLKKACNDAFEWVKYIILLNCGSSFDIVDLVQAPEHITFFICDSHRPVDVHNIYNQVQVKLVIEEAEVENIPTFHDVFNEDLQDDSESDEEEDDDEAWRRKRMRLDEGVLERRMKKRQWRRNRQKILFEYNEFSYWGRSVAMTIFDLAWKCSKENNEVLWLAIIGMTEQLLSEKIDRDKYIDNISLLQPHVSRLNQVSGDQETCHGRLHIKFTLEPCLNLYRHWCFMDAIVNTPLTACRFAVWTLKGKKKMHEFLAEMGLPLSQCRQNYQSMEVKYRDIITDSISQHLPKYGISEEDIMLPTFEARFGFKMNLSATDSVLSCHAILNCPQAIKDLELSNNFVKALDALDRNKSQYLDEGIEKAKTQVKMTSKQVQNFLDTNQVICAGPFLYSFVVQTSTECLLFTRPSCLYTLAKFTLRAYCANTRSKRSKQLPLILGITQPNNQYLLLVGIPPLSDDSLKNCFGKAFEQAAISSKSVVHHNFFDSHFVEVKLEDKGRFFDTLIGLLQE